MKKRMIPVIVLVIAGLMAGVNSQSAMNSQPWHFAAVTDKDVFNEINESMSFGKGGGFPAPDGKIPPDNAEFPEGAAPPDGVKPSNDVAHPDGKKPEGKPEKPDLPDGDKPAAPSGKMASKASIGDTPLAIIISVEPGSEFDAGLATQAMSVEALLLGYGTKIVTSPTIGLNGEKQGYFKELLGVPESQTFCAVILVGKTAGSDDVDAATSATERNPVNEVVTYVKPVDL